MDNIYSEIGDMEDALHHQREAIRYFETGENFYHAGVARRNFALSLAQLERLAEARLYAESALRNFRRYPGLAV